VGDTPAAREAQAIRVREAVKARSAAWVVQALGRQPV